LKVVHIFQFLCLDALKNLETCLFSEQIYKMFPQKPEWNPGFKLPLRLSWSQSIFKLTVLGWQFPPSPCTFLHPPFLVHPPLFCSAKTISLPSQSNVLWTKGRNDIRQQARKLSLIR